MADDPLLQEIVRRTLSVFPRAEIVLFGSRARGDHRPDSDYDLAIVAPEVQHSGAPSVPLRLALHGLGASFDLLLLTPDDWRAMRSTRNSVVREVYEHGQILHPAG